MNKFKDLMAQARQRESGPHDEDEARSQHPTTTEADTATPTDEPNTVDGVAASDLASSNETQSSSRGRGRPSGPSGGKRSHPDYEQVSAYLPRQTYREIKLALLQNEVTTGARQEFSTLVTELLCEWLKTRKVE